MVRLGMVLLCSLILCLLPAGAFAAEAPPGSHAAAVAEMGRQSAVDPAVRFNPRTGALEWLTGSWKAGAPGRPLESAYRFLETNRLAFAVDTPRHEFTPIAVTRDDQLAGWRDVYLQQRVFGLPLLGGRLGFHFDAGRPAEVGGRRLRADAG